MTSSPSSESAAPRRGGPAAWQQALVALANDRPAEAEAQLLQLRAGARLGSPAVAACESLLAVLAWLAGDGEAVRTALARARELVPARPALPEELLELSAAAPAGGEVLPAYLLACGEQAVFQALGEVLWRRRPETGLALGLARLCLKSDLKRQAGNWCDRALECDPRRPELLQELAELYYAAERFKHAAVVALRGKQRGLARQALDATLAQQPEDADARLQLGRLLLEDKQWQQGLAALEPLLPDARAISLLEQVSERLLAKQQAREAAPVLDALLRHPQALSLPLDRLHADRAICAHHLADQGTRAFHFGRAHALASHALQYEFADLASLLPHIYASKDQVAESRQALSQRLTQFIEQVENAAGADQAFDLHIQPLFLLAYQGLNDRELQMQLGSFWWRLLGRMGARRDTRHVPGQRWPLRVGFISRYFYQHSVTTAYAPRIARLAAQPDLEAYCFHLGAPRDAVTESLAASVSRFLHLHGHADPAAAILDCELDILVYTDIGMDVHTYALALNRLAPIQMVFAGHPVTTGLPSIDYFISNVAAELPAAQAHYSETLASLDWLSNSTPARLHEAPKSRRDLGLPEHEHLYFCPMTLFKVHPDMDEMLAGILRSDPGGRIYFARYKDLPYHEQLQARWQRSIPDVAARIEFLPWMPQQTLFQVFRNVDVVLDTPHFGGGTTIRMILAMQAPLVTMPGEFLRSRLVLAPLKHLGLEQELVTDSPQAYASRAVEIATDREYRAYFHQRFSERTERFFEQTENFDSIVELMRRAVAAYPGRAI